MSFFATRVGDIDYQGMLSAFDMDSSLLASNVKAISGLFSFGREVHLMNVEDDEYSLLLKDARRTGTRWKGRTRDFKGQFCKMKYEQGVLWAWSHRIFDWTVVLPWTFGQLIMPLTEEINQHAVTHNFKAESRLDAYEQDILRNFATSSGQRADYRLLSSRVHRQHLSGRRNHFVMVPKQL